MTLTLEQAEDLGWGTYGPGAVADNYAFGTPLPKMETKKLGDLESEHLGSILSTQRQIAPEYAEAIKLILRSRTRTTEERDRLKIRRRDAVEATKARSK